MSKLPTMPMWWADFFSKTDHLSNEEQWAYAKLMAKTWLRNNKPFADNPQDIARVLGVGVKKWQKIRLRIAPFFDLSDGFWRQERLEKEFLYATRRSEISRSNGTKGGRPQKSNINILENPAGFSQDTQTESTHTYKKEKEEIPKGISKKERATRWPADAAVPIEWVYEAYASRPEVDAYQEREKFLSYWTIGKGRTKTHIDWLAVWRNWIKRAHPGEPGWSERHGYDPMLHGHQQQGRA